MNRTNIHLHETTKDVGLSKFFSYVYQNVALGLLLCAAISFSIANMPSVANLIFRTPLFFAVMFGPLAINLYMNFKLDSMSVKKAESLYWLYVALVGASISCIMLIYTAASITSAFLTTSGVFFAASVYGRTTENDMSKIGSVITIGIVGIILAMLVNMFLHNSMFGSLISIAVVVIFTALIAYENYTLKNLYYSRQSQEQLQKLAILGSLTLFISFINIFLALLQLTGRRE